MRFLGAEYAKNAFAVGGSTLDHARGAYSSPLAGFKGAYL